MIRILTTLGFAVLCFTWNSKAIAQIVPPKTDEQVSQEELKKRVKEAISSLGKRTATQQAEDFYQYETDDKPCNHCPQYLKLIREVNHIVEKLPAKETESVALQNESIIQLNRLKFMYYEKKISEENGGGTKCIQYQHRELINPTLYTDENTILLAEEALSLPNITTLQYIPEGKEQEIRYFYRGDGVQGNMIVEVVIYPDRRAVLRYRKLKYTQGDDLPDLGGGDSPGKPRIDLPAALVDLSAALRGDKKKENVTETIVGQDVDIAENKGSITVGDGISITSDSKAKLNKQTMNVSLRSGSDELVKIDVHHKTLKNLEVTTVVPLSWKLDDGSLSLNGAVTYDAKKEFSGEMNQTKAVSLGLTDHNHEYLRTSLIQRDNVNEVSLSSRYSLGNMGTVSGTALSDSTGRKEYRLAHGIADKSSSMTTAVGMTADARRFFELQREQKIGQSQSMVLTIRTDDKNETTIMYQYRLSLK